MMEPAAVGISSGLPVGSGGAGGGGAGAAAMVAAAAHSPLNTGRVMTQQDAQCSGLSGLWSSRSTATVLTAGAENDSVHTVLNYLVSVAHHLWRD